MSVESVVVTVENNPFGEFVVTGGAMVDDLFFAPWSWIDPAVGTVFDSITGPLSYTFENFKIAPRVLSDFVWGKSTDRPPSRLSRER